MQLHHESGEMAVYFLLKIIGRGGQATWMNLALFWVKKKGKRRVSVTFNEQLDQDKLVH
jgi:hypothetical protein